MLTSDDIARMNAEIIQQLYLPDDEAVNIIKKLSGYKYVDDLRDLRCGSYIKWISIRDPESIHISKGALFCDLQQSGGDGSGGGTTWHILCKNVGFGGHFKLPAEQYLVFQKLTQQEIVVLSVMDHISR